MERSPSSRGPATASAARPRWRSRRTARKVVVNDIGATVTGEGQDVGPAQRVVAEIEQAIGAPAERW